MGTYAKDTNVSPEQSMAEIKATLKRWGASGLAQYEDETCVKIGFKTKDRQVKFSLPLPDPKDKRFKYTNGGPHGRVGEFSEAKYDQAVRQRYRALLLTIKAKLESVESGIETFEEAFMAQLVLPSGETMGEWAAPQIEKIYSGQSMPPLLGSGSEMRPIPPDIWMMAVAVGKLQRAIDETENSLLVRPMFEMQRKLNQFIYATRKDVKK